MPRKSRQEKALIALISEPTIARAAEVSGISQPTLFRYLQDKSFHKNYMEAKKNLLDGALSNLHKAAGRAVAVLVEVMENPESTSGARVAAARSILQLAIETGRIDGIITRLDALESLIQ